VQRDLCTHEAARRDAEVPVGQSRDTLNYPLHFILLICMAAVLAATSRWRLSQGAVTSFGIYGALHASAIVLGVRGSRQRLRPLLFIALAACLSMLSVMVGLQGSRHIGTLPGMVGPASLLALSSGLGATSYAVLVRRFWIADLSLQAFAWIALGCVLASLAVLMSGIVLNAVGGLWIAAGWWFAFSGGLWCHDGKRMYRRDGES
jgi:hypothetical protein